MKVRFCGAANGVTGSCHLITCGEHQVLFDCGQFQGGKQQERLNYDDFPFDPAEIECVVLSHAHIDHCGRLPLLVKRGFKGKIYCTDATADLLDVMLKDSGYIHEKEAEWQNRKNERAGRPLVEPLYTFNDAAATLAYVEAVRYDQLIELNPDMKVVFNEAGHILGSAIIELFATEDGKTSKIVFSGDLGVIGRPILRDPKIIKKADQVIMETTYGNRVHPKEDNDIDALIRIVVETTKRGGSVIIPSFAVGRTQELIYELNRFYDSDTEYSNVLKDVKVYVDSPMAVNATEVFQKNSQVFDDEMREYIMKGDDPLKFKGLFFASTTEESQRINMDPDPKIIISASGMCEAGRIRHHLKHNLWDARNSVIFVGYQAEGTLGRRLVDGEKDITLFGESIHVAAKIHNLEGFSGHADKNGLLEWLGGFEKAPKQIFLVHGELESKEAFAYTVKEKYGYDPVIVREISEFELETADMISVEETTDAGIDKDEIRNLRSRIWRVHDNLENALYNSSLIATDGIDPARFNDIRNIVIDLEKNAANLSSKLTKDE